MAHDTMLYVAGYPDPETAQRDFTDFAAHVKAKDVAAKAMILVAADADGKVTVRDTGDHLGRRGAGWGGAVGVLVGLFAPPLLGSVAVGAAAGAVVGKFTGHKIRRSIEDKVAAALKPGSAVITYRVVGNH